MNVYQHRNVLMILLLTVFSTGTMQCVLFDSKINKPIHVIITSAKKNLIGKVLSSPEVKVNKKMDYFTLASYGTFTLALSQKEIDRLPDSIVVQALIADSFSVSKNDFGFLVFGDWEVKKGDRTGFFETTNLTEESHYQIKMDPKKSRIIFEKQGD